jgi:hypothetical protein
MNMDNGHGHSGRRNPIDFGVTSLSLAITVFLISLEPVCGCSPNSIFLLGSLNIPSPGNFHLAKQHLSPVLTVAVSTYVVQLRLLSKLRALCFPYLFTYTIGKFKT